MVKAHEQTQPQDVVATPEQQFPPLYGNENYVSDRPSGRSVPPPAITGADWLVDAKEIETVLYRGDAVSYETLERLFLQSVPVIEAAAGATQEPLGKKGKRGNHDADDDDDQDKRNRG